jgi:antitoxin HigA-1
LRKNTIFTASRGFLFPSSLTETDLLEAIQIPFERTNEIVSRKRGVTPSTAFRSAKFFGMSLDFWMILQMKFDLFSVLCFMNCRLL